MNHQKEAETFAKSLLVALREVVDNSELNYDKLPRWFRAANIRLAKVNGSTIVFFERTPDKDDQVVEYRKVDSDVEFVFPNRRSSCEDVMFDLTEGNNEGPGLSSISNLSLAISSTNQCFTNIYRDTNHLGFVCYNVMVQYEPEEQIEAVRYLPFALFLPSRHVSDFPEFWSQCAENLLEPIGSLYDSSLADYRSEAMAEKGVLSSIDDSVIILGNYDDPFESELRQIRDYLIRLGYDAFLIKDLPAPNEMSLEEKVKLWTTASRFCVMVDREASGHIKEYEIVKSERKPLALLRPQSGGSTWMIGDDELIDLNYIKTFEFTDTPLGATKAGIQWAEDLLNERGKAYPEFYPWIDD